MPTKTISATDAARSLSDLLNRIHYRGERFVILRNGSRIAEISPPAVSDGASARSLGDFVRQLADLPALDDRFGDDLAEIRGAQPSVPGSRWES